MTLPVTVDFHAHAQSPRASELIAKAPANPGGEANPHNQELARTRYDAAFRDINVRLHTMDRERIDMQAVSPAPNYAYWADADLSDQIVTASNEHVAEICASNRDRFVGLCHVSLQQPELAAKQLTNAMTNLGMRGVEIGTRVEDVDLDDPSLDPFWAAAQEQRAPIFIHPAGTTLGKRVSKYYLSNLIGNPLDTTIALTNLIFGGVLDRFPMLNVVAAHGGGYLPSYFARTVHGHQVRPEAQTISHPPIEYLHRLWIDNLVFEPLFVAHLVKVMGASRIVLGTDYPFDMGQENPVDLVEAVPGLSEEDARRIKGGNAIDLLHLR